MNQNRRKKIDAMNNIVNEVIAIKEVLMEKKSIRGVAQSFGIPKSCLQRYIAKVKKEIPDFLNATDCQLENVFKESISVGPNTENACFLSQFMKTIVIIFFHSLFLLLGAE